MDADVSPKAAALLLISGEKRYDAVEEKLDTGILQMVSDTGTRPRYSAGKRV